MLLLHGSGKTAVLVNRVVRKVIDEKIDIDKLLIVTFTNAAASEMKERILEELYKKIEENPNDKNLQKQIILLNKASISTIHAFCLDVIKNYFYEIGVSPNFRLADTEEVELLKQEVIEELFDKSYEENSQEFIHLINTYTSYRGDDELKEIILKVFRFIQSTPFPKEWLNEQVEKFNPKDKSKIDFSETIWGQVLIENFIEQVENSVNSLENIRVRLNEDINLKKYADVINNDINGLKKIIEKEYTWDDMYNIVSSIEFLTWPRDTKIDCELKEEAKAVRDEVKKKFIKERDRIFIYTSKQAKEDIFIMYDVLKAIQNLVLMFSKDYEEAKREKNIIDFNDIEHLALKILVNRDKDGNYIASRVAKIYKEKFEEIAIDEYQDSNLVQEYILTTISKGNNIFMVGDVKQSIYKFRQARPELFLQKYNDYESIDINNIDEMKKGFKIKLFKNFRSRKEVLDITNIIFRNIMSRELGDINYTEDEYLNLGATYPETENNIYKPELHIIDVNSTSDGQIETLENSEIEAKLVANKIKEMVDQKFPIYDKNEGYRSLQLRDIAILLRTTSGVANIYEKELSDLNLSVFSDTGSSYFEEIEVQTIICLLKIIDNPNNDIPLVTVLRSMIGDFSDNELLEIRLDNKNVSFYEALCKYKNEKADRFLQLLKDFQNKQEYLPLDELIWYIYEKTGYYNYVSLMPNGNLRIANLKKLFEKAKEYEKASFKGLYNFINYLDKVSKGTQDIGAAKIIGENENVIRIMSIHKSKGLEFPVVFLCGTGKQFNVRDLNENILLHQDMGFGPKYIDYERKIEYATLAKEAMKVKSKSELLSEEMRLLYVALTRAKEKLIISGVSKNSNEEDFFELLAENNVDVLSIKNAKSYLDWLQIVYRNNKNISDFLEMQVHNKNEILNNKDNEKEQGKMSIFDKIENEFSFDQKEMDEINRIFNWKYLNEELTRIKGKSSVTDIANSMGNIITQGIKNEQYIDESSKPKFLSDKTVLTRAEVGTIVHLVLQKLDFNINYDEKKVKGLIDKLVKAEIISKKEAEAVNINNILLFTQSDLYNRIQKSKSVFKEQPFYINISAKEIYNNDLEENILVQGIIDLYFIDENDEIILVDYKTDYVKTDKEDEFVKRYEKQLKIYKRAIEKATNRKVKETYIYSIYLNRSITI